MEEKNKSAVESFLEGTSNGQENIFENTDKNMFALEDDQQAAQVVEEEVKPLPFNKDPKVLKFIEKEVSKRMADYKDERPAATTSETNDEVTDVLVRLIGNDTPEKLSMVKEFKKVLEKPALELEALKSERQREAQAEQEATEELETAFENIEENYNVDFSTANGQKVRKEFASFIEKIAPKDANGDIAFFPDMNSSWETFQEIQKGKLNPVRAKELASRSMARSAETSVQQPKRVNWNTVEEFMDTLK